MIQPSVMSEFCRSSSTHSLAPSPSTEPLLTYYWSSPTTTTDTAETEALSLACNGGNNFTFPCPFSADIADGSASPTAQQVAAQQWWSTSQRQHPQLPVLPAVGAAVPWCQSQSTLQQWGGRPLGQPRRCPLLTKPFPSCTLLELLLPTTSSARSPRSRLRASLLPSLLL